MMMTAAMAKVMRTRWPACQLAAAKPLAEEPEEVVEEPVGLQEAEEEAEAAAAAARPYVSSGITRSNPAGRTSPCCVRRGRRVRGACPIATTSTRSSFNSGMG